MWIFIVSQKGKQWSLAFWLQVGNGYQFFLLIFLSQDQSLASPFFTLHSLKSKGAEILYRTVQEQEYFQNKDCSETLIIYSVYVYVFINPINLQRHLVKETESTVNTDKPGTSDPLEMKCACITIIKMQFLSFVTFFLIA